MSQVSLRRLASLVTACPDRGRRPFIALENIESGTGRLTRNEVEEREAPEAGAAAVEPGFVLFGKLRPYLAKTWLADRPVYASTELLALRPREGVDSRWLAYACSTRPLIEWSVATSDGAKMPRTNWEKLGAFRLQVPGRSEQREIADYLDAETSRIDALIEKKQRMIDLIHIRLTAARLQMVSGLGASSGYQAGPAWLGSVPANWRLVKLKYLARMESGHTPNREVPEYWENCVIPWVTLNDVGRLEDGDEFTEPRNCISELGLANSSARILPAGTVILSRDATIGRATILGVPMAISQHFVGWICGGELSARFLLEVLRGPLQGLFSSLSFGSTIATIGMPELRDLVVPVPPFPEQHAIADRLHQLRLAAHRSAAAISEQVDRLLERRQALITTAVAGQLNLAKTPA